MIAECKQRNPSSAHQAYTVHEHGRERARGAPSKHLCEAKYKSQTPRLLYPKRLRFLLPEKLPGVRPSTTLSKQRTSGTEIWPKPVRAETKILREAAGSCLFCYSWPVAELGIVPAWGRAFEPAVGLRPGAVRGRRALGSKSAKGGTDRSPQCLGSVPNGLWRLRIANVRRQDEQLAKAVPGRKRSPATGMARSESGSVP